MKKVLGIFCASLALFVAACNTPSILVSMNPRYGGMGGFPDNGKGIITFKIEHNGRAVQTWWGHIENGHPTGQRLLFTRNGTEVINKDPEMEAETAFLMLEPGIYYLSGFDIRSKDNNKRFNLGAEFDPFRGWGEKAGQPTFLGVEVKAGEDIVLPTINLTYRVTEEGHTYYYMRETAPEKTDKKVGQWIIGTHMNQAK